MSRRVRRALERAEPQGARSARRSRSRREPGDWPTVAVARWPLPRGRDGMRVGLRRELRGEEVPGEPPTPPKAAIAARHAARAAATPGSASGDIPMLPTTSIDILS